VPLFKHREPTGKWWIDHSLSLVIGAILALQLTVSVFTGIRVWVAEGSQGSFWTWWFHEINLSTLADTFGVLLIVLLSKWLYERGSNESKGE
jgi:hypothetical protein